MAEGFISDFKRFFFRGLAAVLPTILTLAIIFYVIRLLNQYIGQYINIGLLWLLTKIMGYIYGPGAASEYWGQFVTVWHGYFWWVGFALAVVAIYIFGRFVASYIGRWMWHAIERALFRMPVVRAIYPHVKQVTDFLFSQKQISFSRVVSVQYPRKGIWSIGMVTGPGMRTLQKISDHDLLTVFVPSSPMPFTGYTITVRRDEVIDLPMSVDDALRFTVSAGVILPATQQLSETEIEQVRKGMFPSLEKKETQE